MRTMLAIAAISTPFFLGVGAGSAHADACTDSGNPDPCLPAGSIHTQWDPPTQEQQEADARRATECHIWLNSPATDFHSTPSGC